MKILEKLRPIIGRPISEGKFGKVVHEKEISGSYSQRDIIDTIIVLVDYLEEREKEPDGSHVLQSVAALFADFEKKYGRSTHQAIPEDSNI